MSGWSSPAIRNAKSCLGSGALQLHSSFKSLHFLRWFSASTDSGIMFCSVSPALIMSPAHNNPRHTHAPLSILPSAPVFAPLSPRSASLALNPGRALCGCPHLAWLTPSPPAPVALFRGSHCHLRFPLPLPGGGLFLLLCSLCCLGGLITGFPEVSAVGSAYTGLLFPPSMEQGPPWNALL